MAGASQYVVCKFKTTDDESELKFWHVEVLACCLNWAAAQRSKTSGPSQQQSNLLQVVKRVLDFTFVLSAKQFIFFVLFTLFLESSKCSGYHLCIYAGVHVPYLDQYFVPHYAVKGCDFDHALRLPLEVSPPGPPPSDLAAGPPRLARLYPNRFSSHGRPH